MKKFFRIILTIFLVLLLVFSTRKLYHAVKYYKEPAPEAVEISSLLGYQESQDAPQPQKDVSDEKISLESEEAAEANNVENNFSDLPEELNLKMTFYPQAPFGDWSYPWQEACEEASVLLAANLYLNKNWSREEFNEEILKMVDWEVKRFGYYEHTSMAETAVILQENFEIKSVIHENPTFEQVKEILAKGHLIIMPFAGKKLGNPFYKNGGPVYHALVVKGYTDEQKIITADVGTRRGEDYVYRWGVIEEALHDYAQPIESGAKRMIEVIPPAQ